MAQAVRAPEAPVSAARMNLPTDVREPPFIAAMKSNVVRRVGVGKHIFVGSKSS
jgi:hypothetical protein